MNATELYRAGKLNEAIQALGAALRSNPGDVQRRTFLFELLCFAGEYDRAEKQLDVLALENPDAGAGALLYRSAVHAQRTRQRMFSAKEYPQGTTAQRTISGTLNGQPFSSLSDADPRVGARLEIFAAGQYTWIPMEHLESVQVQAPKQLRDLLWATAIVRTGPSFRGTELGEVLLPVLSPTAAAHPADEVRLGRVTEWEEDAAGEVPVGQKLLLVDGEEVPFLKVRELEFTPASTDTA